MTTPQPLRVPLAILLLTVCNAFADGPTLIDELHLGGNANAESNAWFYVGAVGFDTRDTIQAETGTNRQHGVSYLYWDGLDWVSESIRTWDYTAAHVAAGDAAIEGLLSAEAAARLGGDTAGSNYVDSVAGAKVPLSAYIVILATNATYNISAGSSAATVQAMIDAAPHIIPSGLTMTFQFANGTYEWDDTYIYFNGFRGGGSLLVSGNRGEAAALHTTQAVIIDADDGSQNYIDCFRFSSCSLLQIGVEKIRFNVDAAQSGSACRFDNSSCFWFKYNYVVGNSTGNGIGCYVLYGSTGWAQANYFTSNKTAIYANNGGWVVSDGNDDTGTRPLYGLWSVAGFIQKTGTQPAGSSANEVTANGGQIW